MKNANLIIICLVLFFSTSLYAGGYSYEIWADNGIGCQSAANYGNYLFLVKDKLSSVTLYDLESKKIVYTLQLEPRNEKRGGEVINHCNQSCFGKDRLESDDPFPLLYVSQRNPNNKTGAYIDVFRIIVSLDDGRKIKSFQIKQIQRIFLPVMTDKNSMGNPNVVIDTKKGFLYTYSRNNRSKASNYRKAVITQFQLPSLFDENGEIQNVVYLHDSDIIDSFNCDFNLLNAQGGFYRNGKIYFVQGFPSKKEKLNFVYFREIDLKKRKLVRTVDMLANGFRVEPEGCWYYNGYVMIAGGGKKIYKLSGKKYRIK